MFQVLSCVKQLIDRCELEVVNGDFEAGRRMKYSLWAIVRSYNFSNV